MNAETLRIATYGAELQRHGPGLLLAAIEKGDDPQITAAIDVIVEINPDILLVTSFDYDRRLVALSAFADQLSAHGVDYPYLFALRPNKGLMTALDLDGDGRLGGPGDAQGFGYFAGQGGMAILSRLPIVEDEVRDFSGLLWRDFPGALLPEAGGMPFPSEGALAIQRLSTSGHWVVPIEFTPGRRLSLLAWAASPPVFDGPEDRNGRRNHDETRFWSLYFAGQFGPMPEHLFILLGNGNIDPHDGDGITSAIDDLLHHPALQDPRPTSAGAVYAAQEQGGANARHLGPPDLDTADWKDRDGPGNLRVDYVLPSADLKVERSWVFWPLPDDPFFERVTTASSRRPVVVEVTIPD